MINLKRWFFFLFLVTILSLLPILAAEVTFTQAQVFCDGQVAFTANNGWKIIGARLNRDETQILVLKKYNRGLDGYDVIYINPYKDSRFRFFSCYVIGHDDCFDLWKFKEIHWTGNNEISMSFTNGKVLTRSFYRRFLDINRDYQDLEGNFLVKAPDFSSKDCELYEVILYGNAEESKAKFWTWAQNQTDIRLLRVMFK